MKPGEHGSGDLSGLPEVDPADPVLRMEGVEEFDKGSDLLKKVKSIEFAWKHDKLERQQRDLRRLVQRHKLDSTSLEVAIAHKTGQIRNLQRELDEVEDGWKTQWRRKAVLKALVSLNFGKLENSKCFLRPCSHT